MATPPDVALQRLGQIKGDAATWGAGPAGLDKDRAMFLRLGSAEVLDAFMTNCVFKGKTRERNIRGGRSVSFPITGKMAARYHQPGTQILGQGNDPSDLNQRVIELDALMVADAAIYQVDELMNYYDIRQIYTKELGRSLAYEYDKRVARMIWAAANNSTEPLAKNGGAKPAGPADNTGRVGKVIDLGSDKATFDAKTRQARGDELVEAIFSARVAFEEKDVPIDNMYAVFSPDDYYSITQSSRAINVDFNGGGGANGTIATGETARIAGIPLYSSNHVVQPAYTLVAGDYNTDYQQDLSKCRGLIFHRDAVGVVSLLSPSLQMTGSEFRVQYQSDLLVARQALGMGQLRAECACAIKTT
jgi:hypothetical protein